MNEGKATTRSGKVESLRIGVSSVSVPRYGRDFVLYTLAYHSQRDGWEGRGQISVVTKSSHVILIVILILPMVAVESESGYSPT